jgi:hypothetical protein
LPIIGLFFGGLVYAFHFVNQEDQKQKYLVAAENIQQETSSRLNEYNTVFSFFELEPGTAIIVLAYASETEKILDEAVARLNSLDPPPEAEQYHEKLLLLYTSSRDLSGELALLSEYLGTRNYIVEKLSDEINQYNASVKNATTILDIVSAAHTLHTAAQSNLDQLRALNAPIAIYSNAMLEENLTVLISALSVIEQTSAEDDGTSLEAVGAQLQELFSRDWKATLTQTDSEGLESYNQRVAGIDKVREEVASLRKELE